MTNQDCTWVSKGPTRRSIIRPGATTCDEHKVQHVIHYTMHKPVNYNFYLAGLVTSEEHLQGYH